MMSSPMQKCAIALVSAAALLAAGPGCGKKGQEDEPAGAGGQSAADRAGQGGGAAGASARPAGPTGTISGRILFTGTPPEMPVLQRGSDAFCATKEMRAETVLVGADGGLQNVLVRITPGAVPGWVPEEPAVVDQVDCMYRPRVQGAVRGQMLHVVNSDGTAHNVNARRLPWGERRDTETLFNRGQPAGSPVLKGPIHDGDIMKLKCDSHGWMQGFVVVGDSPYHGTSGEDGRFTIEHAPAGSYQLQAWHEFYGIKTAQVTVEDGKTAAVDFTFDAEADRPASAGTAP
jgi:hypothetical protein